MRKIHENGNKCLYSLKLLGVHYLSSQKWATINSHNQTGGSLKGDPPINLLKIVVIENFLPLLSSTIKPQFSAAVLSHLFIMKCIYSFVALCPFISQLVFTIPTIWNMAVFL